jgi:hypothetical protein
MAMIFPLRHATGGYSVLLSFTSRAAIKPFGPESNKLSKRYWDHVPVFLDDNPELIGDTADLHQHAALPRQSERAPRSQWAPS